LPEIWNGIPPPAPAVAEIVSEFRLCPTDTIPAPDTTRALFSVPDELSVVLPDAEIDIVEKFVTDGVLAEIINVESDTPTETIPSPETDKEFWNVIVDVAAVVLPVNVTETFAAAAAGTEIVTDPAPTPTDAIPAPEKTKWLLKVPAELEVVLPEAVNETVEKLVTEGVVAEIVIDPAPAPTEIIPAPDTFKRFENVPADEFVVFPNAVTEIDDV